MDIYGCKYHSQRQDRRGLTATSYLLYQTGKRLGKIYNRFSNWKHIAAHANMENKTYYIFRDNKLISTVKP